MYITIIFYFTVFIFNITSFKLVSFLGENEQEKTALLRCEIGKNKRFLINIVACQDIYILFYVILLPHAGMKPKT